MERLLKVKEVAERLGVSQRTVHRLIRDGALKSCLVGSSRRISMDGLRAFVEKCEASSGN